VYPKHENLQSDDKQKGTSQEELGKAESSKALCRGGCIHSSEEISVMEVERRDAVISLEEPDNLEKEETVMTNKPFDIPRCQFIEAFKEVREKKGSAGIDNQTIEAFEGRLDDNLYKLWNRMSSGTYFPKPVKQVLIPKKNGKMRPLGIPTVEDRVAQTVVKMAIEPALEQIFLDDSYGYRPNRSPLDAIATTRKRCWEYDWVVEFDIVGLFDNIDHELLYKALERHVEEKWAKLYLMRWCEAPCIDSEGIKHDRTKGVSQGGVTSPLLANLFMHYAFDLWMKRAFPGCPFERFADDAVIHCKTEAEAREVLEALEKRMAECYLELHPDKTRIVYCKDDKRKLEHENIKFDFLGYTFKARRSKNQRTGEIFTGFLPAVSIAATIRLTDKVRALRLNSLVHCPIETIAKILNPIIRGWMNYFGSFYPSEMRKALSIINGMLKRWVKRKYKGIKSLRQADTWLKGVMQRHQYLFYHWAQGFAE